MLEALYKYAIEHDLTAKPGFKYKNVKYYISFSINGEYIGLEKVEDGTPQPLCPDIGENNTQGDKCNFLVVKAEILLNIQTKKSGVNLQKKHDFYFNLLKQASEHDEVFQIAYNALNTNLQKIKDTFFQLHPKPNKNDILSIKVNNKALESCDGYQNWWIDYYNDLNKNNKGKVRCLITGELIDATDIIDKLNTALPSSADYKSFSKAKLICFDKDAFQSYGLEKSYNAPVSKEAIMVVNSALDDLLQRNVHSIPGAKHIYWYSADVPEDIIELPFSDFGNDSTDLDAEEKIQEDQNRVEKMFDSINKKIISANCPKNKYYMMSLCAYKTRVMIRSYDEGTYNELWENIQLWFKDICIDIPRQGRTYCSLFNLQKCLLKKTGKTEENQKIAERMNEELSGVSPRIVYSIYHGTPLPDTVAVKALAYIRSQMYGDNDDEKNKKDLIPDRTACQILKAWLNRKYRNDKDKKEEDQIMDKLNVDSPSVAYQTGRLMAVYALIQNAALGDVGAGVVERYYTSACSSPALVMGKLATMSQYHLSKLKSDNPGLYVYFNKMLEKISLKIGNSLPKTFKLNEQSEFALGYYFQRSQKYSGKETEE